MTFQRNVGGADRIIRIVLGLVIMAVGYSYGSPWGLLGIVVLATGIFRFCLLYPLLGISTRAVRPASRGENGGIPAER